MISIEQTDSFETEDDEGNLVTVFEYTKFNSIQPVSGAERRRPGSRSYKTSDGEPVNYIEGDRYKTVMSEKMLRRIQ